MIWPAGAGSFSIRESDRCLETARLRLGDRPGSVLSVSASRIVASKLVHLRQQTALPQ